MFTKSFIIMLALALAFAPTLATAQADTTLTVGELTNYLETFKERLIGNETEELAGHDTFSR